MRPSRNPNPPLVSPEQRAEIIALAVKVGATEAAKRTGHKAVTIRKWVQRAHDREAIDRAAELVADLAPPVPAPTSSALEVVSATEAEVVVVTSPPPAPAVVDGRPWAERRRTVALEAGQAAEEALRACRDAIARGDTRRARDLVVAFGVLVDKSQLLAGSATARTETRSITLKVDATGDQILAETERLRAELGIGGNGGSAA